MPARDVIVDVKYQCTCGIECNIEHLYWSDTCSKLVCPSLTCSREEIESYYCNLVLENMSTQEAMQYQNRSSNGFVCPDCEATLSTMKCTESKYCFFCQYCFWDSTDIQLSAESPELLMMQVISNEREAPYESRTDELIQQFKSKFHPPSNNHTRATPHRFPIGPWKWQDMEDQLQRKIPEHERTSILNPLGTQTPWFERVSDRLRQATDPSQLSTRTQKLQQPMISSIFRQDLVPLRPLLRTKRSRKCLDAVVKHNQPGFLVKPQVGPLTGDSSMYGSTSWFKKANLALGYIPHVTVEKLPFRSQADPQMIEMWLRFRNPLDDNVKIECAFHTSSMQVGRTVIPKVVHVNISLLIYESIR